MKEFIFPERVVWEKETYRDNYGKMVIEPLERGYGVTLGNLLRRVLLSSIEGIAITSLKIEGVSHEFSTIPGVKEDVVEMVMNLKQVVLKPVISEFPHVIQECEISGKEEICAGDLINDNSVEVLNKGLHIATLLPEKSLKIQLEINKGRGYISQETFKLMNPRLPIETIIIDGIFSPVRKVAFHVDNTRVGQFVDYEKLIMEVWTTGAISPKDAVNEVTDLMHKHFTVIKEEQRVGEAPKGKDEKATTQPSIDLSIPIEALKFPTRVLNALQSKEIKNLGDLISTPGEDLGEIKNLGKKSIEEIEKVLLSMGLRIKTREELSKEEAENEA